MTDLLYKLKLIQDLNFKLNVSKTEFTKKFRENVDESDFGFEMFEVFQSSKNEYKGNINGSAFELKKRKRLFDTNYSFAKVTGSLIEKNDNLVIDAEISGFRKRMIIFFAFIIFFYLIAFTAMVLGADTVSLIFFPFLLFHMSIMLGIPYFVIRRSVKRMAYDLERDFHYWITRN